MQASPHDALLIREAVPLAPCTTLGIGGPARFFADARSEDAVPATLAFAEERDLPVFVLGGGSNLLIADAGFPGLVLRLALTGSPTISNAGETVLVTAPAGADWDGFVAWTVERGLAGIECLSGIPGWVGGAPVQNIGAYGQEVSQTIVSVRAYDRQTRRFVELSKADCGFAYRTSVFNTMARDRYLVTAVTFALTPGGAPALRYADLRNYFAPSSEAPLAAVRDAVRTIRARKAMVIRPGDPDCRSAGSFFKNPIVAAADFARIEEAVRRLGVVSTDETVPRYAEADGRVKIPAAWLIERAGFHKGYGDGPAGLSTKHTLAIVNRGGARARDVLVLVEEIQHRVHARFGVTLRPEPVFVGFEDGVPDAAGTEKTTAR